VRYAEIPAEVMTAVQCKTKVEDSIAYAWESAAQPGHRQSSHNSSLTMNKLTFRAHTEQALASLFMFMDWWPCCNMNLLS
jgi:hypothetical protein